MNKLILFVGLLIFLVGVSAEQTCQTYDDFSSWELDNGKWEELIGKSGGGGLIDEYYVDTENQNYHTAQLFQANKGVELKSLYTLQAGDILEFDLIYNFGGGNHWGCAFWDETSNWYDGLTCIGHWNEVDSHSGEFGMYHIKAEYKEAEVDMEMTLPNGSVETWTYKSSSYIIIEAPYTFSIVSRTGHNGLLHFDYDNFVICREGVEPNLEERVTALEQKVEELEDRTSWLESVLEKIAEFIKGLPKGLRKGWNS